MPSSISNSDPAMRAPAKRWWVVSGYVCVFTFALIAIPETAWRITGHRPSVVDSPALWAHWRRMISNERTQVVLLGASRIQLGFSTATFRQRFPTRSMIVLAIDGTHPMATLQDLAKQEDFCGIAICSITAASFLRGNWEHQREYVEHFHNAAPADLIEPAMTACVLSNLVVANPRVSLMSTLKSMRSGTWQTPLYLVTQYDRSRLADYSLLKIEEHRRRRIEKRGCGKLHEYPSWAIDTTAIKPFVETIQARGGKVVFVRFPTTDEHWIADERSFPKHLFWDEIEKLTGAETIHFLDVPGMSGFECPDTSHLDYRDAPAFTNALLDELVRREILPGSD